jgi:hypothetical protein
MLRDQRTSNLRQTKSTGMNRRRKSERMTQTDKFMNITILAIFHAKTEWISGISIDKGI